LTERSRWLLVADLCSIPAAAECVVAPRRSSVGEGCRTPALRHNLTSTVSHVPAAVAIVTSILQSKHLTFPVTTMWLNYHSAAEIMTGLRMADTEDDKFILIVRAVYGLAM